MMKKYTFNILAVTFITLLGACAAKTTVPVQEPKKEAPQSLQDRQDLKTDIKKCICIQLYLPVCGSDHKTYSNACFAKCANVEFTQGACDDSI